MQFLTWYQMFFVLIVVHSLCDYPLQGEFLSTGKNRNTQLGKIFWPYALSSHAFIHGGGVFLVTGSLTLALLESAIHAGTDWLKCEGKISMLADQIIHYACKAAWVAAYFLIIK